jgi:hypothetical protein
MSKVGVLRVLRLPKQRVEAAESQTASLYQPTTISLLPLP